MSELSGKYLEAFEELQKKLETHELRKIPCMRCGLSGTVPEPSDLPMSLQPIPGRRMICPECHGGQHEWIPKPPKEKQ